MNIVGDRILLRAIEREDIEAIRTWSNDPAIARNLASVHFPASAFQQERWYERSQSDEQTIRLAVEHIETGTLIGMSGFWKIHWRDRRAEHAVLIGSNEHRGKGLGQDIIRACVRYGFDEMDLYRLDAAILADNESSVRAYEACGFVREGCLRGHARRQGGRVDRLLYGLTADDVRTA